MPSIPVSEPLGYLGVFLLIVGIVLVLAGLKIIKIQKITITPGKKTWVSGVVLVTLGAICLIPEIADSLSPVIAPVPTESTPLTITNVSWNIYLGDERGSSVSIKPVSGTSCAIKISFDLKEDGWVAIYKRLDPQLLSRGRGIRFFYKGTGAPNTIELKLIDKDDTIFEAIWPNATVTDGPGASWEALYRDFKCRKGSGRCLNDKDVRSLTFDPEEVDRIDFAFSNKPDQNDIPGSGEVIIEEIQILP